ncbi:MAG: FAD-dependent oxidoreductase [Rhodothermaceae bacterium]
MYKPKKIVIIGGNAAGPAAAAKAKRVNPEAEVVLYEAGEFISTGTCELPYLLSEEISDYKNIVFFSAESFKQKKGVDVFTFHKVESINRRAKTISVTNLKKSETFETSYDTLILATGSKANQIPEISDSENSFTYKSVGDYIKIKNYIDSEEVENITVFGAGYIGLEVAEALSRKGYDVKVIDKNPLPLAGTEPEVQNLVLKLLTQNNVEFICSETLPKFFVKNNKIERIKTSEKLFDVDMVIVCTGVKPETQLAVECGLATGAAGAIKVDKKLRTADQFIYAAGDNCEIVNLVTNKPDYLPQATVARMQGHTAGENAAGGNSYFRAVTNNVILKLFDHIFVEVGLTAEKANELRYNYKEVSTVMPNKVKVMPDAGSVFGKIVFDRYSKNIFGASFFGKGEISGYGNIISLMIKNKIKVDTLADTDFNYTPAVSPFLNILNILGKKTSE